MRATAEKRHDAAVYNKCVVESALLVFPMLVNTGTVCAGSCALITFQYKICLVVLIVIVLTCFKGGAQSTRIQHRPTKNCRLKLDPQTCLLDYQAGKLVPRQYQSACSLSSTSCTS